MRKKEIEKIPYLGLKKISRKEDVKYIGVTAVKIVGNKKHLFLEVYKNEKESKTVPVVRIILAKKEFWNYFPETEQWTRQKVEADSGYGKLIWTEEYSTRVEKEDENILQSMEDLERIKKFCKIKIPVYYETRWWEYIYRHEDDLVTVARIDREHRKFVRRQEALKDRIMHTAKLPEKRILEYADKIYFHDKHHLYYKKRGSWAKIACSKCGGVTDARWKDGISYESQFQKHIEKPRETSYFPLSIFSISLCSQALYVCRPGAIVIVCILINFANCSQSSRYLIGSPFALENPFCSHAGS